MLYNIISENVTFGEAFDYVNEHTKNKIAMGMRLPNWSKDVVVRIQYPDDNSKMTAPYLYVDSRYGRVPWKETMIELFSNQWQVVKIIDVELVKKINKSSSIHSSPKNENTHICNEDKCSPECSKRCLHECDKYKKESKQPDINKMKHITSFEDFIAFMLE